MTAPELPPPTLYSIYTADGMDAHVSDNPKLAPILLPRPSSQPSQDQNADYSPGLSRSRSALPESSGSNATAIPIIEPKPEVSGNFGIGRPEFLRPKSRLNPALGGDTTNMHIASTTPRIQSRGSGFHTPRPANGDMSAGVQQPPELGRPLNVTDALSYLDAVKVQFQDKPDVYNHLLDIMKDFKGQLIDTPGVIDRVSMLFHGNPVLIQGFNTFLPVGYRIDVSADPHDPNMITVTTPMGTSTQSTTTLGLNARLANESNGYHHYPSSVPLAASGSRPMTPQAYQLTHGQPPPDPSYPHGQTAAAASFLGNLGNRNPVEQRQPQDQFNHAIQYLNKIKARYSDDPNKYKQFLDILQTHQKEHKNLQDSQVYVQVQSLFKDAPDLLSEFKNFLPDVSGTSGISLQHPSGPASSWVPPDLSIMADRGDKSGKRVTSHPRRRKRVVEKDTTPAPPVRVAPSRSKKAKHHHRPDPQSPPFSPYQRPVSPDDHAHNHGHSTQIQRSHSHHSRSAHHTHTSTHHGVGHSSSDELLFFDRAKKALETREAYDDFLKLLGMFSKDIIDAQVLIQSAESLFGDGDLMNEFRALIALDGGIDSGPPGSIRTTFPEALSALPVDDGEGPSYRRLPDGERTLACSGRDQLSRSVLNNEWVSHPAWATEEVGFVAHKKNSFEEVLHKCEEERHEYHVQLEALKRTIAIIEPLNARIDDMTADERAAFRLPPDFGGSSKCLYHRVIKKIYGREAGLEVLQSLQDCPIVAIPVVLSRLKLKSYEWQRAQREWSRTWREVDAKNFYKSLDHQGISFKANDKKNITAKHFMTEIEAIKTEQIKARDQENQLSCHRTLGFQLEFSFHDTSILHDSLKLIYSFLDHSPLQYSPQERRSVEKFLRSFIPLLCMYPAVEFNAACGPLDSIPEDAESNGFDGQRSGRRSTGGTQSSGIVASVLRKKLLRTAQEKAGASAVGSRAHSPAPSNRSLHLSSLDDGCKALPTDKGDAEDVWIRETLTTIAKNPQDRKQTPLFVNTTFYTLLRLLQLLYSRLLMCNEIGAKLAAQKHASFHENPIAVELGLDDPYGPSAVLAQEIDAIGDRETAESTNVTYLYLLDACEKVFDNELDQATFEEHMRWFFGNKAYYVFTLDKLITALVKQVQTILSDYKCQEFLFLIQNVRSLDGMSNQDIIRYRREAEGLVGAEDPLYKIEWCPEDKLMRIQMVGEDEPSVDGDGSALSRWQEYVDTYIMQHPTEWMPKDGKDERRAPVYLRRSIETQAMPSTESSMAVRISFGTYKLFYEAKSEDFLWRQWGDEEGERLWERAKAREDERRKSSILIR